MSIEKLDLNKKRQIEKQIKKLSKKVNLNAKASESQFSIATRRFRRNPVGILGLVIIFLMFFMGIFATPMEINVAFRNEPVIVDKILNPNSTRLFTWSGLAPYNPEDFFDIQIYNSSDYYNKKTLYAPAYQAPGVCEGPITYGECYVGYVYDNRDNFTEGREVVMNHVFGTNRDSQDLLSRLIQGARISLFVSIGAVLLAIVIGLPVGLMAGFYGGRVDELLMRITDLFLNLPFYLLILLAIKLINENPDLDKFLTSLNLEGEFFIFAIIVGLGIFGWTGIARLVRAQIFQIKSMDYVEAARALGASPNRIMFRHILPNVMVALVVVLSIAMGVNIVVEAAISFLLFNTSKISSWGVEISQGLSTLSVAWWPVIFPGIFITIAVLGFNLLGDAINDAFDPRGR